MESLVKGLDVVAFDPGTKGGMFCRISRGKVTFFPLPITDPPSRRIRYEETWELLDEHLVCFETACVIENVWVHNKQGAVSGAKFIETYAAVRSMFMALVSDQSRLYVPSSRSWKSAWGLPGKRIDDKASGKFVEQHFPTYAHLMPRMSPTTPGKVLKGIDQNKAEAFLLALTPYRVCIEAE